MRAGLGVHAADSGEGLETVELMTSGAAVGALAQLAQIDSCSKFGTK